MNDNVVEEIKGCFSAVPRGIQYAATAVDVDRLSLILERERLEARLKEHIKHCSSWECQHQHMTKDKCERGTDLQEEIAAIRKELGQ